MADNRRQTQEAPDRRTIREAVRAERRGQQRHGSSASRPSPPVKIVTDDQQIPGERSEGELSCSEEEESQNQQASVDSVATAVGVTLG